MKLLTPLILTALIATTLHAAPTRYHGVAKGFDISWRDSCCWGSGSTRLHYDLTYDPETSILHLDKFLANDVWGFVDTTIQMDDRWVNRRTETTLVDTLGKERRIYWKWEYFDDWFDGLGAQTVGFLPLDNNWYVPPEVPLKGDIVPREPGWFIWGDSVPVFVPEPGGVVLSLVAGIVAVCRRRRAIG